MLSTGSILAITLEKRGEENVSTRNVVVGFVLIVSLLTGSVLLIGYVAAAASLLAVLMLLVKRAIRRDSRAPIESFVPRWGDAKDREAA